MQDDGLSEEELKSMWDRIDLTNTSSQKKVRQLLHDGRELSQQGDDRKSIETLLQCVELDPENLEAHYYLGLIYTRQKNFNHSIVHLNEIVMSPYQYIHLQQVRQVLGYIYALQEDYENAREQLFECLKSDDKNLKVLSILGFTYYREKNYELARDYYDKVLGIDDKNANAYNSLGMIYIETEENIDEGISICKKALEIQPDSPAYLDSIGWGYYKKKDDLQAIEYLKQAYEKAPDSQEIKRHLQELLDF